MIIRIFNKGVEINFMIYPNRVLQAIRWIKRYVATSKNNPDLEIQFITDYKITKENE